MDNSRGFDSTVVVVAAALVAPNRRILVQKRASGRSMAGLWEFPGGKIEPRERPSGALVRELGEELGIAVAADALEPIAFSLGERGLVLLLFGCRTWTGEPRPLDAAELRWCDCADLHRLAMPPPDIPLIDPLARWLSGA